MRLPGISAVYFLSTESLPAYCREISLFDYVLVLSDLHRIHVGPEATASDSTEAGAEGSEPKTTVSFTTELLPFRPHDHVAFVIMAADGETYLVGTKEPPFATIKVNDSLSTPQEGKAGVAVTIEWPGNMMPCHAVLPSF